MISELLPAIRRTAAYLAARPTARTVGLRTELLLLTLILAAAAAFRFATISTHSIWVDEAYTFAITQLPARHMIEVPFDTHPALFFLLQKVIPTEAGNEASLRLMAALTSLAGLIPLYLLARWLMGNVGALTVTALNAVAYTNLVFANDARNYPLLILFTLLAYGALLQFSRRVLTIDAKPGPAAYGWAALYMLASIAALYTHHIAVFLIIAANTAMLTMFSASLRAALPNGLKLIAVNVLVVLAWIPLVLRMSSVTDGISWLEQSGPVEVVLHLAAMVLPDNTGLPLLLLYLAVLIGAANFAVRRRGPELHVAVSLVVLYPLMIWVVGYIIQPAFMARTILPALLGSTLLIGSVAAYAARPAFAAVTASAAILITAWSGIQYLNRDLSLPFVDNGQPQQDWRAAVASVEARDGSAIVLCWSYWLPSVIFYAPDADVYIAMDNGNYWPITEDQWRYYYGLPAGERRLDRQETLAAILASFGNVPADARTLAARHPDLTLLEVYHFQFLPCAGRVLEEYAALTGHPAAVKPYTGLIAYDLTGE